MKDFKIRASAAGKIMTNGRGKNEMGKTALSYCQEWLTEQIYGRRKDISNKYISKGLIMEDNSLDFIAEQLGYETLLKNTRYIENDFMQGTPDVILAHSIIDVKNSWDCFTFPLFENDLPNSDYYYQMQVYMALTDRTVAKVIYVLSDTPANLIEKEAHFKAKDNGMDYADVLEELTAKMTYSDIANKFKLKIFEVQRNDETIKAIEERVIQCREYIETLLKSL